MVRLNIILSCLFFILTSCEDRVWDNPLDPQNIPEEDEWLVWSIPVDEEGRGQLEENSAAGISLGSFYKNSEYYYTISSQEMDNTAINYFVLNSDSGVYNLELSYGSINFEALTGSKQVDMVVLVNAAENQIGQFTVRIKVINVNETPYFTNLNQIPRYADEYVDYDSPRIEWIDTDEGDNPELTTSNLPGWLSIDSEGNIGSSSLPESGDVGNHEFLLKIEDEGGITVQEEINIEVRENLAPEFTNLGSIPNSIRVGCYDDNDNIVDLNWRDINNHAPNFNGNDIVTFTHQGTESVEWLNFDNDDNGKLFCVRAPWNGDAGTTSITVSIEDNRPSNKKSTEYLFDLELIANDAPQFSNLGNFPDTMSSGDTLTFDVEWQDPNSDVISFSVTENFSWFTWDNSGNITAIPTSSHVGSWEIPFNISDGCYTSTSTKILTID